MGCLVCIHINNSCSILNEIDSYCSLGFLFLTVKCLPIFLPWEFSVLFIDAVYMMMAYLLLLGTNQIFLPQFFSNMWILLQWVPIYLDLVHTNVNKVFKAVPCPIIWSYFCDILNILYIFAYEGKALLNAGEGLTREHHSPSFQKP